MLQMDVYIAKLLHLIIGSENNVQLGILTQL